MFYDKSVAGFSEVIANTNNLKIGSNWSLGTPRALMLWIYGDPANIGNDQLYVKVDNSKFQYNGDIAKPRWESMIVDLTGVDLKNVSSLAVGIERSGGCREHY